MAVKPKRAPDAPPPADAISHIFLLLRELEPLAREAGEVDLLAKLKAARAAAAQALERLGHSGR